MMLFRWSIKIFLLSVTFVQAKKKEGNGNGNGGDKGNGNGNGGLEDENGRVDLPVDDLNTNLTAEEVMGWVNKYNKNKVYGKELQSVLKANWKLEAKLGLKSPDLIAPNTLSPLIGDIVVDLNTAQAMKAELELILDEEEKERGRGKYRNRTKGNSKGQGQSDKREKRKIYFPSSQCRHFSNNIRYDISAVPTSSDEYGAILQAISDYNLKTCLNFFDVGSNNPDIKFTYVGGYGSCYSYVCGTSDPLPINVGPGCASVVRGWGTAWHEIGHAISMVHEMTRPDRDQYVDVLTTNNQYTRCDWRGFGNCNPQVPYDFESVMHYSRSSVLLPTAGKQNYLYTYGQRRDGPSFYDTKSVNIMYCSAFCTGNTANCLNGGYPNPNSCFQCICPDGFSGSNCGSLQPSSLGTYCGVTELTATGVWKFMQSPIYGTQISPAQECIWRIQAPAGSKIRFEFDGTQWFGTTAGGQCGFNYVEVKYEDLANGGARFCNFNSFPNTDILSDGNTILVIFRRSYLPSVDGGFRARYIAVPGANACASNPCFNGATCNPDGSGYNCDCAAGFTGENCFYKIVDDFTGLDDNCLSAISPCYRQLPYYISNCVSTICETAIWTSGRSGRPDGSSCGTNNQVCQDGNCVEYPDPLPVTNGQWTEWNTNELNYCAKCGDTNCKANGIIPIRLETRTCTNPSPKNGGTDCFGEALRAVECGFECTNTGMTVDEYQSNQCPAGTYYQVDPLPWSADRCFARCRDLVTDNNQKTFIFPDGSPCPHNPDGRCYFGSCYTQCDNNPTYYVLGGQDECPSSGGLECCNSQCENRVAGCPTKVSCQGLVCNQDYYCCVNVWDETCATLAQSLCDQCS